MYNTFKERLVTLHAELVSAIKADFARLADEDDEVELPEGVAMESYDDCDVIISLCTTEEEGKLYATTEFASDLEIVLNDIEELPHHVLLAIYGQLQTL